MTNVHIGLRISTDMVARIQARADKEGKSFSEAARDGLQFWLDTTDNRIGADVIPFTGRTGVRLIDKKLHTVALRDDPLGRMYDDRVIDDHQYEIGKHVALHFEIARGNQPKSNTRSTERTKILKDFVAVHPVQNRQRVYDLDEIRDAKRFLATAHQIIGASRYKALRLALDRRDLEPDEPVNIKRFVKALDMLAELCGYVNKALAA